MLCYKCFTNHQLSDSTHQLIIDGLSKNLQILQQETSMSQKQLEKLSQLFISLQKQFNKKIMEILQNIENELESIKIRLNQSIIIMRVYIQPLTEQKIKENIEELKFRSPKISEFKNQFKIQIFQQFLSLQKSQNQQIRLETMSEAKQQPLQNINQRLPTTKYQQSYFQNGINQCYALAMNYNERILACGDGSFIKIWNFNDQLEKVQTLKGHTLWITCLSFSKISNLFASGSADHSIRIWKELQNDYWECQQIIVGHKDQVQDILFHSNHFLKQFSEFSKYYLFCILSINIRILAENKMLIMHL